MKINMARFVCLLTLCTGLLYFIIPTTYARTKVIDYIEEYDSSENLFIDWLDFRLENKMDEVNYSKFDKESRLIPFPLALEYESTRAFVDEKIYLYDKKTPIIKRSGYKNQSVLFYVNQTSVLKQTEPICITGPDLEIRKYLGQQRTENGLYRLSDDNIKNFYIISSGSLETDDLDEIHVVYNVRHIEYYDTLNCFDDNEVVRVKTLVYGVWGLSNYDVYNYVTKRDDKKFSYKSRGIWYLNNRQINESYFLKTIYDYYKITVDQDFNPFGRELKVGEDGGLLYDLRSKNESVGFVFIKDMEVVEGQLKDINYERVCINGPAKIYASGYYNQLSLQKSLKRKIPYIYEQDDIVFLVETSLGYTLLYGIMPEVRYPSKYEDAFCGEDRE